MLPLLLGSALAEPGWTLLEPEAPKGPEFCGLEAAPGPLREVVRAPGDASAATDFLRSLEVERCLAGELKYSLTWHVVDGEVTQVTGLPEHPCLMKAVAEQPAADLVDGEYTATLDFRIEEEH